ADVLRLNTIGFANDFENAVERGGFQGRFVQVGPGCFNADGGPFPLSEDLEFFDHADGGTDPSSRGCFSYPGDGIGLEIHAPGGRDPGNEGPSASDGERFEVNDEAGGETARQ